MNSMIMSAFRTRIDNFPSLPTVATRVLEIAADDTSSANDLMGLIRTDQSLTAAILKRANSAYFGRLMAVSSLKQALCVLGFNEIRNLVLSRIVLNSFRKIKRFDMRKFWEHCFLCGLAAEIIAADLSDDAGAFFTAGLIHDIGKLVICMELPDQFAAIVEAAGNDPAGIFRKEFKVLGTTHEEVGMMLLKKWTFPETLLNAVGFHHRPWKAKSHSVFPVIVHAADFLTYLLATEGDEAAVSDLMTLVLSPDTVKIFQSHGITWNTSVIEKYTDALDSKKEEAADILSLLLS